jgi:sugar/nucleoside kinase (ribokinase family)
LNNNLFIIMKKKRVIFISIVLSIVLGTVGSILANVITHYYTTIKLSISLSIIISIVIGLCCCTISTLFYFFRNKIFSILFIRLNSYLSKGIIEKIKKHIHINSEEYLLDVVGIGALNLDYIYNKKNKKVKFKDFFEIIGKNKIKEETNNFKEPCELPADIETTNKLFNKFQHNHFVHSIGGSAFNTIYSLSAISNKLKLGYIGVAGKTPFATKAPNGGIGSGTEKFSRYLLQTMEKKNIDSKFIKESEDEAGKCISFMGNDRVLFTSPFANMEMASHLKQRYQEIVYYLSKSKIVHLTSFIEHSDTEDKVLQLLKDVKKLNPFCIISFDPGEYWTTKEALGRPSVRQLLTLADIVFCNEKELKNMLEVFSEDSSDIKGLFSISRIVKFVQLDSKYNASNFSYKSKYTDQIYNIKKAIELDEKIIDSTGAGDVFSAGVIYGLLDDILSRDKIIELSLNLVKQKLQYHGMSKDALKTFNGIKKSLYEKQTERIL